MLHSHSPVRNSA